MKTEGAQCHRRRTGNFLWITMLLFILPLLMTTRRVACGPAGERAPRLYAPSDGVTILRFDQLRTTVYASGYSWVLQVFNGYCGHCIDYAPAFKGFANSVRMWSHILRLGVLDTTDKANEELFTHYNLKGVPSLLFVAANTSWERKYETQLPKEPDSLRRRLLDLLQDRIVQLRPLSSNNASVVMAAGGFLLEESSPGVLSRSVILDFLPDLHARWTPVTNAAGVHVRVFPFDNSVGTALDLPGLRRLLRPGFNDSQNRLDSGRPVPQAALALAPARPQMTDILSALTRALVSDVTLIGVEKPGVWSSVVSMCTLCHRLLSRHSPCVSRLLTPLVASLPKSAPTTDEWKALLKKSGFPTQPPDEWVGCKGSQSYLRGYPCGLWQLFHSLTTARLLDSDNSDPVLPKIRAFVLACFSCRACAANFDKESARLTEDLGESPTPQAELLWLWRTHNRVNRRLAGAASEDPRHPKTQFPSSEICGADCDTDEGVVRFLVRWYGPAARGDGCVEEVNSLNFSGVGFSNVDLSLCCVFFFCGCAILLVVFCRLSRCRRCRLVTKRPAKSIAVA